jgi:hypothetical protein
MVQTGERTWHWKLEGPPHIENWPGKRFFIMTGATGAARVLIRGNTFGTPGAGTPAGTPKILVERSRNVQIVDNTGL